MASFLILETIRRVKLRFEEIAQQLINPEVTSDVSGIFN